MVSRDATTIWELWNGDTADPAMNSGNHVMLVGDLLIWMYECLAGIAPDPEKPAFRHVIMKPRPAGDLSEVKASHRSSVGPIRSAWKVEGPRFVWSIELPPGATATIHVPAEESAAILEGGRPIEEVAGIVPRGRVDGTAVFEIGSGRYTFESSVFRRPGA
jgi:alpha-L-rhamnosidase